MKDETIERFMELSKDLRREAIEEEHARDLEILEAADKLLSLVSTQISSMNRRLGVLQRMLQGAEMAKEAIERRQEERQDSLDAPLVESAC